MYAWMMMIVVVVVVVVGLTDGCIRVCMVGGHYRWMDGWMDE